MSATSGRLTFASATRIYDKLRDGKTKNEHVREMLLKAVLDKQVQAKTVLFDSRYSSSENLKVIHRLGLTFYTAVEGDRVVSTSKEAGWGHGDRHRISSGLRSN